MKKATLLPFLWFLLSTVCAWGTELALDRASYVPGEPVVVRFNSAPGNVKDWVGLYEAGKGPQDYVAWQYLDGTEVGTVAVTDGEVTFPNGAPTAGTFTVRLLENDSYVTLAEVEFTAAIAPRVRPIAPSYKPAAPVSIRFLHGPGNSKDWVGIYRPGDADASPLDWFYVDGTQAGNTGVASGTLVFPGGFSTPGTYEIRFFRDDSYARLDVGSFVVEAVGPTMTLVPGDRRVTVEWQPVTVPAPVVKYRILTASSASGPFSTIAEVTGTRHVITDLTNGTEYCFAVQAVTGSGEVGPPSIVQCTSPYVLAADEFIAIDVPPGTTGNFAFNGELGVDFEVVNPVRVDRLGTLDDGANGLKSEIVVTLYNRITRAVVASATFSPAEPGVLRGGSRFKVLSSAVDLPKGFKGTIVGRGYSALEKAGTTAAGSLGLKNQDGGGSLFFSGVARNGPAGEFPQNLEPGAGVTYAAATFGYRTTAPTAPGKPRLTAIPGNQDVALFWPAVKGPLPAQRYQILASATADGPFQAIGETADTLFVESGLANGSPRHYRVRAIAAGNVEGVDSEVLQMTPDLPAAGVPYVVPENTEGNQAYGGSIGNDFDVLRPIRITQLGVFDDGGDGLKRTLKCRIYDRVTRTELALLVFDESSPGELVGGTRFKTLATPLDLPMGFQGAVIASGYGEGERDGNRGAGEIQFSTFTGGCLKFVGRARWGDNPDSFPEIIDGGPADRYAAGNFRFEPLNEEPSVSIAQPAAGTIRVNWKGVGVLTGAPSLGAPWDLVLGAVSGSTWPTSTESTLFRVRVKP